MSFSVFNNANGAPHPTTARLYGAEAALAGASLTGS